MNSYQHLFLRFAALALSIVNMAAHATTSSMSTYTNSDRVFIALANEYIDHAYFPENPTLATIAGHHDVDDQLEDYSKKGIQHHLQSLKQYEARINAIDSIKLSGPIQADRDIVLNHIRSEYLTLATIRPWEKNPDFYPSSIANSVLVLIERDFSASINRLKSVIAREKKMVVFLRQAKLNIQNPPKIYTDIALEQLPGTIRFFEKDLPKAFTSVKDATSISEFKRYNHRVIQALKDYQQWLRHDILPRAHGDFRLGTDTFRKKLMYDEMVDAPLDHLLTIGIQELRKDQAAFKHVAHEIGPKASSKQVLRLLESNHPTPDQLLNAFQNTFSNLIDFIHTHPIISLPTTLRPTLKETPAFLRATLTVTIDVPGPLETNAKEAYFTVTLPEPNWDTKKTNDYMFQFSYPTINIIAIHTAFPGHFIQLSWLPLLHDRVRQLFTANSNEEGWTLYCEKMMLDEGFGKNNRNETTRATNLLRLGQLHEALLRDARYIVSIKMQTGQMSMQQAIRFFEKEAYQPNIIAVKEAKRNATDPTYLSYTLGKIQIVKLRDDLKAKQGREFNLEEFHNALMQQGSPPIKIVRKALLHDNSDAI
jgi:uncharacterized protein (DUF885 family)